MRISAVALIVVFAASGVANAAYMFDWTASQPHMVFVPDPSDTGGSGGYDILSGIWWGMDADYQYFRMDLKAYPTVVTDQGDIYGIYVDAVPGVGGTTPMWMPTELSGQGIDLAIIADFVNGFGDDEQVFMWNGASWVLLPDSAWNEQPNGSGGYSLEWRIAANYMDVYGTPAPSFWGAVVDEYPSPTTTLDITDKGVTPEPTTMALLGLGLGGLYLKRRRKS